MSIEPEVRYASTERTASHGKLTPRAVSLVSDRLPSPLICAAGWRALPLSPVMLFRPPSSAQLGGEPGRYLLLCRPMPVMMRRALLPRVFSSSAPKRLPVHFCINPEGNRINR